jgi:adenylate cyclase
MNEWWQLRVYDRQELVYVADLSGAAELGRQSTPEEPLFSRQILAGRWRVVIADNEEKSISRKHVVIEPLTEGGFRITNQSSTQPMQLGDGRVVAAQASAAVVPDGLVTLGKKTVRFCRADPEGAAVHGLAEATLPPGQESAATPFPGLRLGAVGIDMKTILRWLQAAMDVLQSAADSAAFFDKAARAIVELVNLDSGRVLLLDKGAWQIQAVHSATGVAVFSDREASRQILNRVRQERRTFWEVPALAPAAVSLHGVAAVVAAPILDRHGTVIGALYGDRRQGSPSAGAGPISEVEALLVEILARGVAAGLARLEQERAALAARVQFEQFFTPELARHLAAQPDLLQGRDAEVTLLFCDVRGFSRISEVLGPARTGDWIGDVMGTLSDCVRDQAGVLVDYVGDELIAMWGAPGDQPDHARLACRAALAMQESLPRLNARWQPLLQESLSFGIGINTGVARVGNTGSHHKFKYGPLGNTVNLASRVQGATKYLKCQLLITGTTRTRLDESFATRRLGRVKVVNIVEPVVLYELAGPDAPGWPEARTEYEKALAMFENRDFRTAARSLADWRARHADDGPALVLLHRAVQCMVEEPDAFDPIWILPDK